jgi:hypothetical protein
MPTISEIAKEKGVSRSTAERRMRGCVPKRKYIKQTLPAKPVTRNVLVKDYSAADVKFAFSTKTGKAKVAEQMARIKKLDKARLASDPKPAKK